MRGLSILHVIPAAAARYGGPSAAVIGMCHALEAIGHRTMVATTNADGPGVLAVPLGSPTSYNGVQAVFFQRSFGEAFKWSRGMAGWLESEVTAFDVVHVHAVFSHSSLAAGRAGRRAGVPYLVRPLGTLDPWSLQRRRLGKQVLLRAGVGTLLSGAAALHYTSAGEQQLAESAVPGLPAGRVVPLGVDDAFFASDPQAERERFVLSLSRFDDKKGLELLVQAFHEAAVGPLSDWRLVVAGGGPPRVTARLKELAAAGPAAARIGFPGWVAAERKRDLLARASLFASPSAQENFGIALAEALAAGVPAIVTPGVNLASDILAAGAGWLTGRSAHELAEGLRQAMTDEDARAGKGAQARRLAEQFRWPVVAAALSGLYADVSAAATAASR